MLAIRLQRSGRKGRANYRMVVQDSHRSPKSGKVVASLGSFNPHDKSLAIDKEKAAFYLTHGAQPSPRVVRLLAADGVKLPDWVKVASIKEKTIRNTEKLRKNRPAAEVSEEPAVETEESTDEETPAVEEETAETEAEAKVEPQAEVTAEETAKESKE